MQPLSILEKERARHVICECVRSCCPKATQIHHIDSGKEFECWRKDAADRTETILVFRA